MRVEKLQEKFEIEIVYRQFPLHPRTPEEGMTLEELFAGRNIDIAASQVRMKQLMAEEGLPFGDRTMTYNSRLAQELAKWADGQPNGQTIHNELFRAYFVENVNLAIIENLLTITERVGLSGADAQEILEQRTFRDAVDADWQRSRELGILSVPTFVVGNQGLVGAQPYEQLEALIEHD